MEELLTQLLDRSPNSHWSIALPAQRLEYLNHWPTRKLQDLGDAGRLAIQNTPLSDLFFWESSVATEDRARVRQAIAQCLESGFAEVAYRLERTPGEKLELVTRMELVRDSVGSPVRLIGSCADITAFVELQRRERVYLKSREALLASLDAIVFEVTPECRFIEVWCRDPSQLFVPPEQLLGKTFSEILPGEFSQRFERLVKVAQESGKPQTMEYPDIRDPKRWFLARVTPVPDAFLEAFEEAGLTRAERLSILITDITLLKEKKELEAAIEVRDDFVSIASHELRTPVTALYARLQLLSQLVGADPQLKNSGIALMASGALADIRRLGGLVDELLDVTRIQVGQLNVVKQSMDLAHAVKETVELIATSAREKGSILLVRADEPVVGFWDPRQIGQVILNLLSNAIKYGESKPIEVSVALDSLKKVARLEVLDHGMGIPAEQIPVIFERFQRAVGGARISGLGLGLYIVKQIIDAHGGRITVQSRVGQGSCFTVELPLA